MNRILLPHDLQSAVWIKLSAHLQERMEMARSKNDGDLDQLATARCRERIKVYKELLALGNTSDPVQVADD